MPKTLHIFDASDENIVKEANARKDSSRVLVPVSADKATKLGHVLDFLLRSGETADQILFDTHGAPGNLVFKNCFYNKSWFLASKGAGWDRFMAGSPFPRIYFRGCHIAQGDEGRAFMEAVGASFLTRVGRVTAHKGLGYFYIPTVYQEAYDGDLFTIYFNHGKPVMENSEPAQREGPDF